MIDVSELNLPRFSDSCILSEGLKIGELDDMSEDEVIEVSPCTSERGNIMAEIDFSGGKDKLFLDSEVFCFLLESYKRHFAKSKCEHGIGFGRVLWKGRKIHVYENGKFKIHQAHDREDAIRSLNSMIRLIFSGLMCRNCGRPAVDCALGKCSSCISETSYEVARFQDYFNGPILKDGFDSLTHVLHSALELAEEGEWEEAKFSLRMERSVRDAIEQGMNFSLETEGQKGLKIGTMLIGLGRESFRLLKCLDVMNTVLHGEGNEKLLETLNNLTKSFWGSEIYLINILANGDLENDFKPSETLKVLDRLKKSIRDENMSEYDDIVINTSEIEDIIKTVCFWNNEVN